MNRMKSLFTFLLLTVGFTTGAWAQSSNMLNGAFTITASGIKIAFSKGNLQQIAGNWQFAEHQYDYLGDTQNRNSTTRDVFKFNDYSVPNDDDSWFVLSSNQWKYLLTARSVTNTLSDGARYTMATLGGTYKGLILFPDSYTHPDGTDFTPGIYNGASNYTATVSLEGWSRMEAAGCVFLPAAGYYSVDGYWGYVGEGVVCSSSTLISDNGTHRYTPWFWINKDGPVVDLDDKDAWCHINSFVPIRLVKYSALNQDSDGNYLIGSLQDWKNFALLIIELDRSVNARMTADIDLGNDQTMIGTNSRRYSGTFDGQGHTLTIQYVSTQNLSAPFLYIENTTLKNIHVAGTINTSHRRAAGLVAESYGTSYISNSWSSVALISTYNGDAERGGFVSCVQNGSLTIDDCYFDGTLIGNLSYTWGGFVGWTKSTSIVNNCLFNPKSVNVNTKDSETFSNNGGKITNCYYTVSIGNSTQGTQIPDGQLADGTITTALQANRAEEVWVQNAVTGLPQLAIFSSPSGPSNKVAYAIWCEGNKTLYFDYADTGRSVGKTYDGQTITSVWSGNSVVNTPQEDVPVWSDVVKKACTHVVFKESFSEVRPTSLHYWFSEFKKLEDITGLEYLNTSEATTMRGMFLFCDALSAIDVSNFDTSKSTSFRSMFDHCVSLKALDVSSFEMKQGDNTQNMFYNCQELQVIYSSSEWYSKIGSGGNTYTMFYNCSKLKGGTGYECTSWSTSYDGSYATFNYFFTQRPTFAYTVPSSGIGTFSIDYNVKMPEGLEAYYCTSFSTTKDGQAVKASPVEGKVVPANTGVLLRGTPGQKYTIPLTLLDPVTNDDNALVAVTAETRIYQTDGNYTNFDLSGDAFKMVNSAGGTVKANSAYLHVLTSALSQSSPQVIAIDWDGETTAIKGDVNGDGNVDVADIATVIDVMAAASGADPSLAHVADVNGDGNVDVADIAAIIDEMASRARMQEEMEE